jgi:Domain of unknown function (DUF4105)
MGDAISNSKGRRIAQLAVFGLGWLAVSLFAVWAFAALCFDVRRWWLRIPAVVVFVLALVAARFIVKGSWARLAACTGCCCIVLIWWLALTPSNDPPWQEDASQPAWAEIHGDQVVMHNVRNCKYRSELDYSDCYSDRTFYLSQLGAVDFFMTNWGLTWASHPILSFQFGDNEHLAFSIEARYRPGQTYSALRGFFRQYGLIFVAADERDVIRLRTDFRKGEEVYLYRVQVKPQVARAMFMTYIGYLNQLKDYPEWYNALTKNCTTTIATLLAKDTENPQGRSIQLVLNGSMDELMYNRGRLVNGGLAFPELKEREHIDAAARAAGDSADFSKLIRVGRVGF